MPDMSALPDRAMVLFTAPALIHLCKYHTLADVAIRGTATSRPGAICPDVWLGVLIAVKPMLNERHPYLYLPIQHQYFERQSSRLKWKTSD